MIRLTHVKFSAIAKFDQLAFNPGKKITLIKGENFQGKTSVLRAITAALGGGTDARLIKDSGDKGEIVLVLDDPGVAGRKTEVTKTLQKETSGRKSVKVKNEALGTLGAGQDWLESMIDLRSTNPIEFLKLDNTKAGKEARAKWLLDSLPIQAESNDLAAAAGVGVEIIEELGLSNLHPLESIRRLEKMLTGRRAQHNSEAEDRERTIKTLIETAPAMPAGDISNDSVAEARVRVDDVLRQRGVRTRKIEDDLRDAIDESATNSLNETKAAEKERDDVIEEARRKCSIRMLEATQRHSTLVAELNTEARKFIDEAIKEYAPAISEAERDRDRMEQALKDLGKATAQKRMCEKFSGEAANARAKAKEVDGALSRLGDLRGKLMANNPLPDITVEDGEIFLHGVDLDHISESEGIDLAFRLGELRAGKIGVMCIDGIESFDPKKVRALIARMLEGNCQYFVSRVTAGPLEFVEVDSMEDFEKAMVGVDEMVLGSAQRTKE